MDTKVMTLADFLLARIAEDEQWLPPLADVVEVSGGRFIDGRARILADCAAKRRIMGMHSAQHVCAPEDWENDINGEPWFEASDRAPAWVLSCATLRALALPYADHPDYRDEWR